MAKLTLIAFLVSLTTEGAVLNSTPLSGAPARELWAALNSGLRSTGNTLASSDGGLIIECGPDGSSFRCRIQTDVLPLRWDDDADGKPYSVEQLSLRGTAARELTQSLATGRAAEALATPTGGSDSLVALKNFLSSDGTLVIQCEQRRITSECVIQKFSF